MYIIMTKNINIYVYVIYYKFPLVALRYHIKEWVVLFLLGVLNLLTGHEYLLVFAYTTSDNPVGTPDFRTVLFTYFVCKLSVCY